jgi:diguanylate cyclase (GGDEF)-like protein
VTTLLQTSAAHTRTRFSADSAASEKELFAHAQGYRLRGVLGAVFVSAIWTIWVVFGASNNLFPWTIAVAAGTWVGLCGLIFITLIKSNLNLRLPDSGLSMYCLLSANFGVLVALHFGPVDLRAASYVWAIIAFSVGNLSSTFRSVRLTASIVTVMALIEAVIYSFRHGVLFQAVSQLAVFLAAVWFIAYSIVVIGKRTAASNRRLEHSALVLDTINEAVFTLDATGNVQSLNRAAAELCNLNSRDCPGKPLRELLRPSSDHDANIIATAVVATQSNTGSRGYSDANLNQFSIQIVRDHKEQSVKFESHFRMISDSDGKTPRQVVVLRDISHISMLLSKLKHEAIHDELTGLLNRRGLNADLQELSDQMRTQQLQGEHALLVVDLDQFKVINDACGHLAGDQLLKEISSILTKTVREGDRLARQGGDEFAVVMRMTSEEEVSQVARTILREIAQLDFQWSSRKFSCGASIGASIINESNLDVNLAVLRADSALYLAKELGRGRFQLYQENDANILKKTRELAWVTRIHQALADNHFELFAQQVKALAGGDAEHFEIFVRLPNAHHGFDSPDDFLPAAERYELMPLIDRWVIRRAVSVMCAQQVSAEDLKINVSVNLSAQSLMDSEFLSFLERILLDSNLSADRLYFEISESIAIENIPLAREYIAAIRKLGCHVALDEVGAGYHARIDLRELECDYIKFDSQLTADLDSNRTHRDLVESIYQLARDSKVKTVAKKVERPATVAILKAIGIDAMQGYWIHKPEPLRAVVGRKVLIAKSRQQADISFAELS